MHSANGEKIEAPKKPTTLPTTSSRDPEKQSLKVEELNHQVDNMPRIQHFFFTLLILALLGLTIVSAASNRVQRNGAVSQAISQEKLRFQELLNTVEPSSLHNVLHQHMKEKYKHGVYQEDKHAMEVVHQENAEVAHSLIELAKRQAGNATTAIVTTTTATTTEVTTTDTQTGVGAATTTSDNSPPQSTTQQSSLPASTIEGGSTDTKVLSTSSEPSSDQSTSSTPASTNGAAPPVSSSSSGSPSTGSAPSPPSPSLSSSGSQGHTSSPSSSSSARQSTNKATVKSSSSSNKANTTPSTTRSVTQQVLYTTTAANGAVSTVTSITVVPADQAQTQGGSGGTSTNTGTASLQTNSATPGKILGINSVLGALGLVVIIGGL